MELNKDNISVANSTIKDIISTIIHLKEIINEDIPDEEKDLDFIYTLLAVIEMHTVDLNDIFQRESKLSKEKSDRHIMLKNANIRIRELEKQISDFTLKHFQPIQFQNAINTLMDNIQSIWNNPAKGLGGIAKTSIHNYFVEIEFIPMFDCYSSRYSSKPETDKLLHSQWIEGLEEKGFVFEDKYKNEILLTDNNIKLLKETVLDILPNFKFTKIRNIDNKIRSISGRIGIMEFISYAKF